MAIFGHSILHITRFFLALQAMPRERNYLSDNGYILHHLVHQVGNRTQTSAVNLANFCKDYVAIGLNYGIFSVIIAASSQRIHQGFKPPYYKRY